MNKSLHIIFTGIVLLAAITGLGQVKFMAYANPPVIGKHEFTQIDFTVENATDVQKIIPPGFRGFTVMSGPNQSTGYRSINGVTTYTYSVSFIIKPTATGSFSIGPAKVTADGREYKSNSLTIEVTGSAQGNSRNTSPLGGMGSFDPFEEMMQQRPVLTDYILKTGEDPGEKIKKNLFIRVETDKKSCYLGEPVVATYKLYTRLKSESSLTQNPSFNGFSVVDMLPPNINQYQTERLNGKEYNVYILRKVQLYPLQPGSIDLEAAEVENSIRFIREEYLKSRNMRADMLGEADMLTLPAEAYANKKITVSNAPVTITVNDVPATNRPASYRGAAGDFSITAAAEKTTLTTDDAGKLLVTIEGSGNMPLLVAPDINWPEGVEVFEPKTTDNINKTVVPVSGSKYFEYSFIISKPGTYVLPSITFSWLDTKTGRFRTDSTKPITLAVSQGTGKPVDTAAYVQPSGERFFNRLFNNRWWVAGPVIALIIGGLLLWLRRENRRDNAKISAEKEAAERQTAAEKEAAIIVPATPVNWLADAARLLEDDPTNGFYNALNSGVKQFLCSHLHLSAADLSKKNVADVLDKKGVSNDTTLQCMQLMDDIEWQLYTPLADAAQKQELYKRAAILIENIQYA